MLEIKNITKIYKTKDAKDVHALDDISLTLGDKGMIFLLGKSGSGKSTLLNIIGGLDSYDNGEIIINGKSSKEFKEGDFDAYRNTYLGFIFQEYNILPEFTVAKNIALSLELQGKKATPEIIENLLREVDLEGLSKRKPAELSGGQKQRIAIARALIKNPDIILADEPTGALDSKTGKQVFEVLKRLSQDKLVIVVSHDRESAETFADRIIELKDGKVISDTSKHYVATKSTGDNLNTISSDLIQIKDAKKLSPDDWQKIGKQMQHSDDEVFIISNRDLNAQIKKIACVSNAGKREVFKDTQNSDIIENASKREFKLIKGKFRLRDSVKMGASGLKYKKVRLFFTIFLSAIALAFFGLSNTLGSFSEKSCTYENVKNSASKVFSIDGAYGYYDENNDYYQSSINLTNEDFEYLSNKYNATMIKRFDTNIDLNFSEVPFPLNSYSEGAYIATDNLKNYYQFTTADSRWPKDDTECVITDVLLKMYQLYGYQSDSGRVSIKTEKGIIGKTLNFSSERDITVVGVLKTDFDFQKYEKVLKHDDDETSEMETEFEAIINSNIYYSAIVCEGAENLFATHNRNDLYLYIVNSTNNNKKIINSALNKTPYSTNLDSEIIKVKSGAYTDSDIIISFDTFANMRYERSYSGDYRLIIDGLYQRNLTYDELKEIIKNYYDSRNSGFTVVCESGMINHNVAGLYVPKLAEGEESSSLDSHYTYLFPTKIPKTVEKYFATYTQFTVLNTHHLKSMIMDNYYNKKVGTTYAVTSQYSYFIDNYGTLITTLTKILLYASIVFALFSALLLMTFIATSISYKKNEIGILRALGAKGRDVYGIFLSESMIISLINFAVALLLTIAGVIGLNVYFASLFAMDVSIMSFGSQQIVLMLGISILVAVIATFVPVYKVAKMKPIDAITGRK